MTMTTQNIEVDQQETNVEQHKALMQELKGLPMFSAFETYVEHMLKEKDIEIEVLRQSIDKCLDEIQQLKTLHKLDWICK